MSIDTHINTYVQDVEDTYKEALAALDKFKLSVEALKTKYATHVGEIAHAVGMSVPEIEALVPQAKPALEKAQQEEEKAAEEVSKLEANAKGSTPPAKS